MKTKFAESLGRVETNRTLALCVQYYLNCSEFHYCTKLSAPSFFYAPRRRCIWYCCTQKQLHANTHRPRRIRDGSHQNLLADEGQLKQRLLCHRRQGKGWKPYSTILDTATSWADHKTDIMSAAHILKNHCKTSRTGHMGTST